MKFRIAHWDSPNTQPVPEAVEDLTYIRKSEQHVQHSFSIEIDDIIDFMKRHPGLNVQIMQPSDERSEWFMWVSHRKFRQY